MKVYDLLLDSDLDLDVQGGDFTIGESTEQHQLLLLRSEQGEWRENPAVGVGINSMILNDAPAGDIVAAIQDQMEQDGQHVTSLSLDADGVMNLQAYYKDNA